VSKHRDRGYRAETSLLGQGEKPETSRYAPGQGDIPEMSKDAFDQWWEWETEGHVADIRAEIHDAARMRRPRNA
jgi:hypothetical protein